MILRRKLPVALLAVLWAVLNPAASLAKEPQTTFTEKIEVNLVDLNVVVTTFWGRPVTDLTRDDFEIWEDGEPRQISHFGRVIDGVAEEGKLALPMASSRAGAKTGEQPSNALDRSIILAFDAGIQRPYMRRALKAARDFVAERSDDGIWWSVVMLASKPHSLLPLTNDAREVVATLESVLAQNKAGTWFQVPTPAAAMTAHLEGEWSRLVLTEQSLTYPYAARNLSEIFRAYASVPGSKACVIFQQGRGGTFATEGSGRRSCLFPCRPLLRGRHMGLWRDLSRQATSAGFKAYVTDVRGLNHESVGAAGGTSSRLAWYSLPTAGPSFGPATLAYHTGGDHFALNNLDEAVKAAARETGTYYSLAFAAPHHHDGQPHDLQVRVPGRRWLQVRSSSGFFDVDPRTLLVERLAAPAHFPKGGGALPLALEVASRKVEEDELDLIATATTPVENLTFLPENGARIAEVDLFLAVHDSTGALVSLKHDRRRVRAPAAAKEAGLSVPLSLRLRTGRYTVTVALYDPVSGLSGTATAHVGGPEPRGDV